MNSRFGDIEIHFLKRFSFSRRIFERGSKHGGAKRHNRPRSSEREFDARFHQTIDLRSLNRNSFDPPVKS